MTKSKEPQVFIHLKPTANELRAAWREQVDQGTIFTLPSFVWSLRDWMAYFNPRPKAWRAISFCPVVVEVDGRYPAVIYLTNYSEQGKSAKIHFAAHAGFSPKTTLGACMLAVDMLLNSAEINLIEAAFDLDNVRARKMARVLGFSEIASAGGCVYCLKTNKGAIDVLTKSTKTDTSASGCRSGHSREPRSSGCRRSRASSSAKAAGSRNYLPGQSNGGRAVHKYA